MPKDQPGPAALYHRVSTLDQEPTLARLGLRAALQVEETGSGAPNDRPGLQRVMDAARRGDVDAVLVWKLDRFGRSAL
jgi:DNA invertase Pin-like site-specific DNA recombinase